jgi:hypothetical protein
MSSRSSECRLIVHSLARASLAYSSFPERTNMQITLRKQDVGSQREDVSTLTNGILGSSNCAVKTIYTNATINDASVLPSPVLIVTKSRSGRATVHPASAGTPFA